MIHEGNPGFVNSNPGQQLEQRNKNANINVKKLQFIHNLTASDTSKTAKVTKKMTLLSSTLTFRRCAGG